VQRIEQQMVFLQQHRETLKAALALAVTDARNDEKIMRNMAGRQRFEKLDHPLFPADEAGAVLMEQVAGIHKERRLRAEEALIALTELDEPGPSDG
jgi:hypothetical protein